MTQWCSVNQSEGLCGAGRAPVARPPMQSSAGVTLGLVVVSGVSRTRQDWGGACGGWEAEGGRGHHPLVGAEVGAGSQI